MTYLYAPVPVRSRVRGPAWMTAAVLAWTVNPVALFVTIYPTGIGRNCSSPANAPNFVPPGCPREGLVWLAGLFVLAVWLFVTAIIGLVFGVIEGHAGRFARGYVVPAVLVAIAAPWAMAGYAIGAGLGRLTPRPIASRGEL